MSQDTVTSMKGVYDAFARRDVPTVLAAMDPLRVGRIVGFQQHTDTAQTAKVVAGS